MTERRFTPQDKKQRRYDKDHVLNVEYPHSFRSSWKRGVRKKNRSYRRKVKHQFCDLENCEDRIKSISLEKRRKLSWQVFTVRERVQNRLNRRRERQIYNYFSQPYNSEIHRHNFVAFLESVVSSDSEMARIFSWKLQSWLYPPVPADRSYLRWNSWCYEWLQDFLCDEPDWEIRLKDWVNSQIGKHAD